MQTYTVITSSSCTTEKVTQPNKSATVNNLLITLHQHQAYGLLYTQYITGYRINNTCKNSTSYTHTTEWLQHKKSATLVPWLHVTYTYFTNYYNLSRRPNWNYFAKSYCTIKFIGLLQLSNFFVLVKFCWNKTLQLIQN